ncbi:unnamed protein product [Prunus armeniaca]
MGNHNIATEMKIIRWVVQLYWASFVTWALEWKKLVVCPLLRMLRDGSRMIHILMICLPYMKSVMLSLSQREMLLPNLQEVKLFLRTQRMDLHRGRSQGSLLLRILKWGLLHHHLPGSSISWVQIARRLVVCAVLEVFCPSLLLTRSKTMICFVKQLVPGLVLPSVKEM